MKSNNYSLENGTTINEAKRSVNSEILGIDLECVVFENNE